MPYIGVDGKARYIKEIHIGVNGVAKRVKKVYLGVNGVAKLVFRWIVTGKLNPSVSMVMNVMFYWNGEAFLGDPSSQTLLFSPGDVIKSKPSSGSIEVKINGVSQGKFSEYEYIVPNCKTFTMYGEGGSTGPTPSVPPVPTPGGGSATTSSNPTICFDETW